MKFPKKSLASPLPMTLSEMKDRGWRDLDILLISGDAYVDHPAFGVALLARLLEASGYKVGVLSQPRWDTTTDVARLGKPRLFVGISAGSTDSLLASHTAHRKRRHRDRCSPGGAPGKRPARASIVYAQLARRAFGDIPVILGGIEASCRRFVHYDFWKNQLRRPILADAKADLCVYGMGEQAVLEIAQRLREGNESLAGIPGTCRVIPSPLQTPKTIGQDPKSKRAQIPTETLPSFDEIQQNPKRLIEATKTVELASRRRPPPRFFQSFGHQGILVEPPPPMESGRQLDAYYEFPYTRRPHPLHTDPIPALDTVQWSITSHRGCFGGCSFCTLALHSGHKIGSRSPSSLVREARRLTRMPGFKGTITDVGGPTANMYKMGCRSGAKGGQCRRPSCLFPTICPDLNTSHDPWLQMLESLRKVKGIKAVRVASGIRHDLILQEPNALKQIMSEFTGGRLRVAPEHVAGKILRLMRKPSGDQFQKFVKLFHRFQKRCPHPLELSAYLITAFPGSGLWERDLLASALRTWHIQNFEVQCFTPTPGSAATAMYASGYDLRNKPVDIVRNDKQRKQSTLLPYDPDPQKKPHKKQTR